MKRFFNLNILLRLIPAVVLLNTLCISCNSKDEDEEPVYEPVPSVAVKSFTLKPNSKVLANLDSVYFSIDLQHGVIFNADSLPKGTPINKLVPVISYPSAVTKAVINMEGGSYRTGEVNYTTNPGDTIDFSGKVTLTLYADDDKLHQSYTIKVNVHEMVADSLMWDNVAIANLPSRKDNPKAQRTVDFKDKVITLIEESDNTYTLSTCLNPGEHNWEKKSLTLPFTPDVRSLNASDNALFILSEDGELFSSSDGITWKNTSVKWSAIIGGFGNDILGIFTDPSGVRYHDIYPQPAGYSKKEIAPDFPDSAFSQFRTFSSKWSSEPMGIFVGGSRDGKISDRTWSFDGTNWADISNTPLPALANPVLIPYFNYRKTPASWMQKEYNVMLCVGGILANGNINDTVFISYDNGVNWQKAPSLLQLPDYVTPRFSADAIICTTPFKASLDNYWKQKSTPSPVGARVVYNIDGSDIDWDCPYIYIFGGIDSAASLQNEILRAVLARLTFSPLF